MNDKIHQDRINKALWAACDTFRSAVSADTYKVRYRSEDAGLMTELLEELGHGA